MFKKISHTGGLEVDGEILFATHFDYLFPEAANSTACLLPDSEACTAALINLGTAMARDDFPAPSPDLAASKTPAIYTYFGQFIDHDLTARTDREGSVTRIGNGEPVSRLDPDYVKASLRNGRRPQFDLDAVFGEAPALAAWGTTHAASSQSQILYTDSLDLKVYQSGGRRDVVRGADRVAIIPDERNDENLNLSQLQCAMLRFFNRTKSVQNLGDDVLNHIRARQLCRWAFQYVVINDWLKTVCDPYVVEDTLANGPRFFGPIAGRGAAFLPLEFSVAGFRFAHSMIRPTYQSNATAPVEKIMDLLGFASLKDDGSDPHARFFEPSADGTPQLKEDYVIDWSFFSGTGPNVQFARKIDTLIAKDLGTLPFSSRMGDPVLGHLARSNLLRGKNLSIPTGQAMADAFGVGFLTPKEILDGEDPVIAEALEDGYFHHRSPLWYYVLREAVVQQGGERLGEVGSRLVCETIIGMIRYDLNSYLHHFHDDAVDANGVDVRPGFGGLINSISALLAFADA